MKTICTLNGRIIMSQDGEALNTMQKNAAQYPGAEVRLVGDDEFDAAINTQISADTEEAKFKRVERVTALFPSMTKEQKQFLVELTGAK